MRRRFNEVQRTQCFHCLLPTSSIWRGIGWSQRIDGDRGQEALAACGTWAKKYRDSFNDSLDGLLAGKLSLGNVHPSHIDDALSNQDVLADTPARASSTEDSYRVSGRSTPTGQPIEALVVAGLFP